MGKNLKIFIFCLILLLGMMGCVGIGDSVNEDEIENKIISYMEKKYKEEFVCDESFVGEFTNKHSLVVVSSEKHPELHIKVGYDVYKNGESFTDNYTHLLFEEDTKDILTAALEDFFKCDVIVTYNADSAAIKNNYNSSTSFENFVKSKSSNISFCAVVSPAYEIDNILTLGDRVERSLKDIFAACEGEIYFATQIEDMKVISEISTQRLEEMQMVNISISD